MGEKKLKVKIEKILTLDFQSIELNNRRDKIAAKFSRIERKQNQEMISQDDYFRLFNEISRSVAEIKQNDHLLPKAQSSLFRDLFRKSSLKKLFENLISLDLSEEVMVGLRLQRDIYEKVENMGNMGLISFRDSEDRIEKVEDFLLTIIGTVETSS